ncbi:phage baseplate assembly protein V [Flavobacteriaceae bacterium]|jgi:phage protein D/phage baseplate assembly protein gpV|nr:phage baseplate assembly protein V [Flavobacteriaceae bacterium]MDB2327451.1 phage baseplate assembly protein V [Flavobacteriaceae bacterium]
MGLLFPSPADSLNQLASFAVKVDGTQIETKYKLFRIQTFKEVNKLSRATISIIGGNPKENNFDESEESIFATGSEVEISLGYDQSNEIVFKGIISKHALKIKKDFQSVSTNNLLVIECVDKAVKLSNTYTTEIYEDKLDSDIITALISNAPGVSKTVSFTSVMNDFLPKYNCNDWDFILQRAEANGMIVLNSDNAITVTEPKPLLTIPELTVTYGNAMIDFHAEVDATTQYSTFDLSSYDSYNEEAVSSTSQEPSLVDQGDLDGVTISKDVSPTKNELSTSSILTSSEAKNIADAFLMRSRLSRLVGKICVKGINNIDIGSIITLVGFGSRFSGLAYVTSLSHEFQKGNYKTWIGFGMRYNPIQNKNKLDISRFSSKIEGLHIGTVTKIDADPKDELRIQVAIPTLKATGDGMWAKLATLYTGNEAGSFFIPEVDSQVVVSFLSNDSRYPIILGSLYTKTTKPYKTIDAENQFKAILSKEKLTLEFDDVDKIITIKTSDDNYIKIKETDKEIEITDINKNTILTSEDGIKLTSEKDITIDAKGKIILKGGKGIDADGGSKMTIKAGAIEMN